MLIQTIILSLQITALYILLKQGMLLGDVRIYCANLLDKYLGLKCSRFVQKPLWDCFTCMSSLWTIILTGTFDIHLMLAVCGLNFITGIILINDYEGKS